MDDIKPLIKKSWPYALGIVAGLWLIMRYSGSSSSSGSDYASLLAAQSAAAAQNAQIGLQQQAMQQAADEQARQDQLASQAQQAQAQTDYLNAQASMASAVGAAASGVLGALYQPTINALNAASYENAAVYQSAAGVAAAGYASQADMIGSVASTTGQAAGALQTWEGVSQGIGEIVKGAFQNKGIQYAAGASVANNAINTARYNTFSGATGY